MEWDDNSKQLMIEDHEVMEFPNSASEIMEDHVIKSLESLDSAYEMGYVGETILTVHPKFVCLLSSKNNARINKGFLQYNTFFGGIRVMVSDALFPNQFNLVEEKHGIHIFSFYEVKGKKCYKFFTVCQRNIFHESKEGERLRGRMIRLED